MEIEMRHGRSPYPDATDRRRFLRGGLALAGLSLLPRLARAAISPTAVPADVRALTEAYNASGRQLFEAFAKTPGNIVFSPYSIGTAMAMALSGARGPTEREMAEVLKQRLPRERMEAANQEAMAILEGGGTPIAHGASKASGAETRTTRNRLLIANALMAATGSGAEVSSEYVALVRRRYGSEVFADADPNRINAWVSKKTDRKIDHILDELSPDAAAILINAIYLKAVWSGPFEKKDTIPQAFHRADGSEITTPMMRKSDSLKWVQQEDYSAIRLPFAGESLGLVIVLPKTPVGLDSVVRSLDHDRQNALFDSIQRESARAVEIRLPKFKASFKASLSEIFETEGMHLALSDGADFSGMTVPSGRPLEIGAILHRAVIELAEEGVEAAAATAVGIVATASIERLPEPFVVDRPFLFFVVDDPTGAVLFEGRIVDPTKSM